MDMPTTLLVTVVPRKALDRKSTRLNSSHSQISYAVFCLKKKILDRRLEALLVVLKVKGIGGPESGVELLPGALIDEEVDVLLGGNAAMVPAIGAPAQRADEPVLDVDVPALVAFLPGVGWNLQLYPFGGAGLTLFFEPGHSRHSGELEGDNLGGAFPRRQPRP